MGECRMEACSSGDIEWLGTRHSANAFYAPMRIEKRGMIRMASSGENTTGQVPCERFGTANQDIYIFVRLYPYSIDGPICLPGML